MIALYAAQRLKAASKRAHRKAKAERIRAKRTFVTSQGEALTLPPRWTLKTLKAKLQDELNAAIRERDGFGCISCESRTTDVSRQAGHLFGVGAYPGVRFHPLNIHVQDAVCNVFRQGNHAAYAAAHIRKYGLATFEALAEEAPKRRQFTQGELLELLTVLRRSGLAGYQERYFSITGWILKNHEKGA